ncbi:MAG TPA: phosphate ABC transporter ATP-binding protein, partial [Alcanivorax sp.]|nr:phosphate ABC transporter ATP-binding protein [Alcanivorax sp.]
MDTARELDNRNRADDDAAKPLIDVEERSMQDTPYPEKTVGKPFV